MKRRHSVRVLVVLSLILVCGTTTGCGLASELRDNSLDVPRNEAGIETWDLRKPPTAEDVGIEDGKHVAAYSTLEPRPVRVLLPDDVVLDLEASTVAFNNFMAHDDGSAPVALDMMSTALPTDEAVEVFRADLQILGVSTSAVDGWERDIDEADPDVRSVEAGDSVEIGYLLAGVGADHSPVDDVAIVTWSFAWGEVFWSIENESP